MEPKRVIAASQPKALGRVFIKSRSAAVPVISLWTCLVLGSPVPNALALPPAAEVLRILPMPDDTKQRILKGEVVRWTTSEASDRELTVGLTLFVRERPENLVELFRELIAVKVVEEIRAHGEITAKGTVSDFAGLVLEPNGEREAQRYLEAEPGGDLNLDAGEIAAFQALRTTNKSAADARKQVERLVRESLLARYQAYRARGLSGIAAYDRGGGRQLQPGQELLLATKEARVLAQYAPSFHEVLLKYPAVNAKELEEWYYWINIEVFGRPTLILSHRLLLPVDEAYIFADRHFYASREYNSLQAVGGALPTRDGTVLIYLYRVSTDQVGGFGSSVKHPVARTLMAPYVKGLFEEIRARAEKD